MFISTLLLSALALLPSPAVGAAVPGSAPAGAAIAGRHHTVPAATPGWTLEQRASSDNSEDYIAFYPNISKVYDLFSHGTNFTQFCLDAGTAFINEVDQRSMLHRFDFSEKLANRTCEIDFVASDFNLYYNSSFPMKLQLFTTMPGTPLGCDNDLLNDQRDRHIADIVITSAVGDKRIVKYSDDFLLDKTECPTSGTQGYELVITGENTYATWGLHKNGLLLRVE